MVSLLFPRDRFTQPLPDIPNIRQDEAIISPEFVQDAMIAQQASESAEITIDRDVEITAMDIGKQFASRPNRHKIRRKNMAKTSTEIRSDIQRGALKEFTPGWAIIGDKPGGVEGGFTVRRVYTGNMANFFQESPEGFAQLQKMFQENSQFLPLEFYGDLGNKTLLATVGELHQSQQEGLATTVMDLTPAYRKNYSKA
ncbi:MAG: hypothetical protein LBD72_03450 [Puniceicoccales bacterium]|jgi:hypothetical protein|nr:hypothetical protein [Puniceicoccales bacterium]